MAMEQADADPSGIVPMIKAAGIWFATGISALLTQMGIYSWGDFAAGMAGIYSCLLIADWIWKKLSARSRRTRK